ncbi:MAG: glutamine amidotransferase [Armatimonadota bacterium]
MKRLFLICPIVVLTMTAGMAAVNVQDIDKGGGVTHVQVRNEYFTLEFAPEKGAQALSFKTRYSPNDWVFSGGYAFFMDHFVGQAWPGELVVNKYTTKYIERTPEKVTIEFQTVTTDSIAVYRRMTFAANSPVIRVIFGMRNDGKESVVRGLWPQWLMYVSGIKEHNRYFRPDSRGVNESGWQEKTQFMGGDDYIKTPYAGWTAALNTQTREGLVWLMDYNWLKWLYNCNVAWTIEWFDDYVPLPKDGKWETEYNMVLVKGFPTICHASTHLMASMTMTPRGDQLAITHTLGRSHAGEVKDVKISAKLRGVDSKESYDLPVLTFGTLTWEPRQQAHSIKVKMDQRLVCDVALTGTSVDGKPLQEVYSYYWPGTKGEAFDLISGTTNTTYYRKPPRKVKAFLKPKELTYYRKPEPKMLELRGLFYQYFRMPEAATKAGVSDISGSYLKNVSFAGSSLSYVPTSFEDLYQNDVVVMNNVDAECLTDFGLEALRQFVNDGGNLIVLGGQFAFSAGGFQDTALADLIPVTISDNPFDMQRLTPPGALKVANSARLLKGLKLRNKPACFYVHDVQPKPEAWVELTAGSKPFLICGNYGEGKVAVVAGTVNGQSAKRATAFWETEDWPNLMNRIFRWMLSATP